MKIVSIIGITLFFLQAAAGSLAETEKDGTDANIFGDVQSEGEHVPFANVYLEDTGVGTTTDITGHYMLINLPEGEHILVASAIGYSTVKKTVTIVAGETQEINFVLEEIAMDLKEVVVTGTRTFKRRTEAPVIVNLIDSKSMESVQSCAVSDALRFQPGLRVETDCQTCNYTQLRMNGLGGGYSQILINSRPIFSPLTGLYGMEQLPTNMIEQVEVVRGGGSALYGSSAIGGTVNIITKIPSSSTYDLSSALHSINGKAMENFLTGNVNMVTRKRNAGAAVFVNRRFRETYDHNGDNFSELPELRTNSFGANLFFRPTYNQKIELSFTSVKEYRYGGEMVNYSAHQAEQSEERSHDVLMGGLDYQINFNDENSSFIAYLAGQSTDRAHFTGIMPDDSTGILAYLFDPPYGYTKNSTLITGTQFNHRLKGFPGTANVLTVGAEYMYDDVLDSIPAYQYVIDQVTGNMAGFIQSDWQITNNFTFLAGVRADKHNLVDRVIFSPRLSALYRMKNYMQFRLTWGTGFRAPQAFDADMHIAFAGGGVSRILLSDDLREERSNSLSASVNYDKATETFIAGFTFEGFYTNLNHAFYLQPIGQDVFGERFEKRNGPGATVQGITLELRGNYRRKAQLEGGVTLQTSLHEEPVDNIEGLPPKREFLRTPNRYGYLILTFNPNRHINATFNSVFTGPMHIAHYAGAPGQTVDEYILTPSYTELGLKFGYTFIVGRLDSGIELFGGVKNILNAYQDDFDTGKNRDSGYIYGPAQPRTIYIGLRLKSF